MNASLERTKASKQPGVAKLPPIDVAKLDFDHLKPVEKEDFEIGAAKVKNLCSWRQVVILQFTALDFEDWAYLVPAICRQSGVQFCQQIMLYGQNIERTGKQAAPCMSNVVRKEAELCLQGIGSVTCKHSEVNTSSISTIFLDSDDTDE